MKTLLSDLRFVGGRRKKRHVGNSELVYTRMQISVATKSLRSSSGKGETKTRPARLIQSLIIYYTEAVPGVSF